MKELISRSMLTRRVKSFGTLALNLATATTSLVVVTLYCCQLMGATQGGDISTTEVTRSKDEANPAVKQVVEAMFMPNFETSLEMKEQADFLLTPAFLVQAAISEKVVITYPTD